MFQDGVKKTIYSSVSFSQDQYQQSNPASTLIPGWTNNENRQSQRRCHKWQRKYELAIHWFPSLPLQQFQVLFNSLFKVLCIFPSRYLYAIGLPPIFSFRWNLPPIWAAIPSNSTRWRHIQWHIDTRQEREYHPLSCPFPRDLARYYVRWYLYRPQFGAPVFTGYADSHGELFLLQSPLLEEFLLVSFPPLNYMLKFSG